MFCSNCGNNVADGLDFCPNCGQKINAQPIQNPTTATTATAVVDKPKKKFPIKALIAIVVAIVVIVVGIIVAVFMLNRVSADSYLGDKISYSGYNGYGTAQVYDAYDFAKAYEDLGGNGEDVEDVLKNEVAVEGLTNGTSYKQLYTDEKLKKNAYNFIACFDIDVDKSSNLSNGDVVTVTVTVDYDEVNDLGLKKTLNGKDEFEKQYTVEGLEEPTVINPFDAIESVELDKTRSYGNVNINLKKDYSADAGDFTVTGEEYYAGIKITQSDNDVASTSFSYNEEMLDESTGKITIIASGIDSETDYVEEYGIVISPLQQEFDVSITDYLYDSSKITKDDYNSMKELAKARFDVWDLANVKFNSAYFAYNKSSSDSYYHNSIYFVYSYTSSWTKETVYKGVYISDIIISSDGSIIDLDDMYVHSTNEFESVKELKTYIKDYYSNIDKLDIK